MRFKTVWVSDVHLGSKGCSASEFIDFIESTDFDTLIMNGDIIDGWRLKAKWFFPQEHVNAIRKVLGLSRQGKKIIYVTGNHDEFLRKFHDFDLEIGNITILNKYVHSIGDKKYLVVHGDGFDTIVRYHKWVAVIGDVAYNLLLGANRYLTMMRSWFNLKPWSLSKYAKSKVKGAADFIFKFEESAVHAVMNKYHGIICGHIHHPEIKVYGNTLYGSHAVYLNSGDWVETCSWIGETDDGRLQAWEWNDGEPFMIKEYYRGQIKEQ